MPKWPVGDENQPLWKTWRNHPGPKSCKAQRKLPTVIQLFPFQTWCITLMPLHFNLPKFNTGAGLSTSTGAMLDVMDKETNEYALGFTHVSTSCRNGVKPGRTIPKSRPRKPVTVDFAKKDVLAIPPECLDKAIWGQQKALERCEHVQKLEWEKVMNRDRGKLQKDIEGHQSVWLWQDIKVKKKMLIKMEREGRSMAAKQKARLMELTTEVKAPHKQSIPKKSKPPPVVWLCQKRKGALSLCSYSLWQCRMFQRSTALLIGKLPFQRLVLEIVQNEFCGKKFCIQSAALLALQEVL